MALVAVSAAYGAAGSRVGPELARRLEVPFIDRGIPIAVAERLDVPVDEALAQEEAQLGRRSLLERLLAGFAAAETALPAAPPPGLVTEEDFHHASEQVIRELAAGGHGVILGRGAVAALREDSRVLRVRLSGPAEARVRLAMALGGRDEATVRTAQRRLDAAHADYLRRFYGLDIDDPGLYHLVLDATAFAVETVVEVILVAVRALPAQGDMDQPRG
jgi:cytidylate kinase